MGYDLFEHRHHFAVWAAARAAQRGLTSVSMLRAALEGTDIVRFVRLRASLRTGALAFDRHHRRWCSSILRYLHRHGLENAAYGHAAKLVAIYLKSMVVVGPEAGSRLASVIHPPIDRILLARVTSPDFGALRMARWRHTAWTSLDKRAYYSLVADLRALLPDHEPFWKLEEYWNVTLTDAVNGRSGYGSADV